MPLNIIVGAQWGDEGKGRIVDWFASQAACVARYNGGDNAGHTVTVGDQIFKLHLIPSGIIHPHATAFMGNGMVINPATFFDELKSLASAGIPVTAERLRVSFAAHLITPAHKALDNALESLRGKGKIGTTGRGIGPAYTDKISRRGLRLGDMLTPDFNERLSQYLDEANQNLNLLGAPMLPPYPIMTGYADYAEKLAPFIADTSLEISRALKEGKTVLAEGAQGTLLDIDHGTYPFVTSSSTTAAGALTGLGVGLDVACTARAIGVVKAFQTRVGSGPFPTEVGGELASRLRGTGANPWDEFGTTTGRPRRVGWLDGVLLRYAVRVNGLSELVVTKLDILSGFETLKLCTGYKRGGETLSDLAFGPSDLTPFQPIYEELPGWSEDVSRVRRWRDLPANAQTYLRKIGEIAGVPVTLVSVGPEREQVVEIG
jgi:adenylosuccinate synthase